MCIYIYVHHKLSHSFWVLQCHDEGICIISDMNMEGIRLALSIYIYIIYYVYITHICPLLTERYTKDFLQETGNIGGKGN